VVIHICDVGSGKRSENGKSFHSEYIIVTSSYILQIVNEFVYELGREETDLRARSKIDSLRLSDDEWTEVELFIDLLKVESIILVVN
jgi:hypothetical protein